MLGTPAPSSEIALERPRFRSDEPLNTIPEALRTRDLRGKKEKNCTEVELLANYIAIKPMSERQVYQYRVEFEPNIESASLRRRLFAQTTESAFMKRIIFDGMSDARSSHMTEDKVTTYPASHPGDPGTQYTITLRRVGVATSFEIIRLYNMHMKNFLRTLKFFEVQSGAYVHPQFATPIGQSIMMVRGFKTGANEHEAGRILMNLESVHKLIQNKNVAETMAHIGPSRREAIRAQLIGKLVVTNYNKIVYKVEDVNFELSPLSTFEDRKSGKQMSYLEYFKQRYNENIRETRQPLLLVVQNNRRRAERAKEEGCDIYLIPELCNIAGLTDEQRNDSRLKVELIRSSQVPPTGRVDGLMKLLDRLHDTPEISECLQRWGYSFDREPVKIQARILPTESIGTGRLANAGPDRWTKVDQTASFDHMIQRESLAKVPSLPKMAVLISRADSAHENQLLEKLRVGFDKVGLKPEEVELVRMMEGSSASHYVQYVRNLAPDTTAALVLFPQQHKERYDAVKKLASVERGLITQVITSKLMLDQRKAAGAAVKIGVQLAAKLGGEPWYANLPLAGAMVCGYDTYHDTANRGRSFGAFVASMNGRFSRWYSKADSHDKLDELSAHLTENLRMALRRYRQLNGKNPDRLFIYRDGVSDGQLSHVFSTELEQIRSALLQLDDSIQLTMIIVNKRTGARFFLCNNRNYLNPPPGTVVDDVVTRKGRFDFYLVSQSTRNGTITPTYYNIIYDDSGLEPAKHQAMAYKLCFLYYNWSGTVRVPAPCQYAHKLALLCGEHLHAVPNANLDDQLHFL